MSRLLGATLLATAQGTSGPPMSFYCVNACTDGKQDDYCINNSTADCGCTAAPAGCHVMAWQTLTDEDTCEAFKASQPSCFDQGHGVDSGRCPGAEMFQLLMDRNRDLGRTYAALDFDGVALNLYENASVVVGDLSIQTGPANVANVYKNWAYAKKAIERVPRKVLERDFNGSDSKPQTLHELGSWTDQGDVDRYTRWVNTGTPRGWQIETDVDTQDTGSTSQTGDYTDAIRERYTAYSTLSDAGNFSGLVADLYTCDAVLALTDGTFVEHDGLENALGQIFGADPHRKFTVSTAASKDGADVVHDVGTVATDSHKYYARWEKCGDVWKIAVQVQVDAGAPHQLAQDVSV